jgi:hypothetical protein
VPRNAALSDEDQEQDPDRWCSHVPCGQECWQIISQWVWNLRLELGHQLEPEPVRTTEFASALAPASASEREASPGGYAAPKAGLPWKAGRFSGRDFAPQADGTLRCPAGKTLRPTEQRRVADGTLRVLFAARILDCRGCQVREQCLLKIAVQRGKKPPSPARLRAVISCICCFLSHSYATGCAGDLT